MSERYVTKSCDKLGDSQNMSPIISPIISPNSVNHQIVHQICHQICHQTPWGSYMHSGQRNAMVNPTWELGITLEYSNLDRLNQFSTSTEMKCHSSKINQP